MNTPMLSSPAPERWRTVLVDRAALFRDLLARAIEHDPRFELVAAWDHGEADLHACRQVSPRLVVIDVEEGDRDGIERARTLIREVPGLRLLALSGVKHPLVLNRLWEIGVHGFVEKDQPFEILEEAMVEVASGRCYLTAVLCRNRDRLQSDPDAFSKILSGREQDVLRCVVSGWTSRVIAERLELSPRSVETYRYRLMRKLGVRNLAALVEFAFRQGLVEASVHGRDAMTEHPGRGASVGVTVGGTPSSRAPSGNGR